MKTAKKSRQTADGKHEVLCGGYVSWTLRRLAPDTQLPLRTQREIRVWMPAGVDYADCGSGTNALVAALKAKVQAKVKGDRDIEVRECWAY